MDGRLAESAGRDFTNHDLVLLSQVSDNAPASGGDEGIMSSTEAYRGDCCKTPLSTKVQGSVVTKSPLVSRWVHGMGG